MTVYRFGEVELDRNLFELRIEGQRQAVQPKALELLFFLVENGTRAVSVDELLTTLWRDESVTPASVRRAVNGARRALAKGTMRSAIQTVRGRGYRFSHTPDGAVDSPAPSARTTTEPAAPMSTFVGRADWLETFERALTQAQAGRGSCLVFEGPAGIGKSALLRELVRLAQAAGSLVCEGCCVRDDQAPALWPVAEVVRGALAQVPPETRAELLGAGARDIGRAMPSLAALHPALRPRPGEIDLSDGRTQAFDAIVSLCTRLSRAAPVVLAIDDLEHADGATIDCLAFLARRVETRGVLLVGARRTDARGASLRPLLTAPATHLCRVEGLSRSELSPYVSALCGRDPSESAVDALLARTGGNPLFVRHLLHAGGALEAQTEDTAPCNAALEGLIAQQLADRSPPELALLRAASVMGASFGLRALAELVDRSTAETGAMLARAGADVVAPSTQQLGVYRFAHGLIREALYSGLPSAERARLHHRAAERSIADVECLDECQLQSLAHHVIRGAAHGCDERSVHCLLTAARRAEARMAYEQSLHLFEQAEALEELIGSPASAKLASSLERARVLHAMGDADGARTQWLQSARVARSIGDGPRFVHCAVALGTLTETGGIDDERMDILEQALRGTPAHEPVHTLLEVLWAKGLTYAPSSRGGTSDGVAIGVRVVQGFRGDKPKQPPSEAALRMRAKTLGASLALLGGAGQRPERLFAADELTRLGRALGDGSALCWADVTHVWNSLEGGNAEGIDAHVESLLSLAAETRSATARFFAHAFRATRAMLDGRLDAAESHAATAQQHGGGVGRQTAAHVQVIQTVTLQLLRGRLSEAHGLVRRISAAYPSLPGWCALAGVLDAELGRTSVARETLDSLLADDLAALKADPFELAVLAPLADLCFLVGDEPSAALLYERLRPYAGLHANVAVGYSSHGPVDRHLGMLAARMGGEAAAERHFEAALEAAQRMGVPLFTCASALAYAEWLQPRTARRTRARELRAWAQSLAQHMGATLRTGRAGTLLSTVADGPRLHSVPVIHA